MMKIEKSKNYGDYVEIAYPIQESKVMHSEIVGGEIWYN